MNRAKRNWRKRVDALLRVAALIERRRRRGIRPEEIKVKRPSIQLSTSTSNKGHNNQNNRRKGCWTPKRNHLFLSFVVCGRFSTQSACLLALCWALRPWWGLSSLGRIMVLYKRMEASFGRFVMVIRFWFPPSQEQQWQNCKLLRSGEYKFVHWGMGSRIDKTTPPFVWDLSCDNNNGELTDKNDFLYNSNSRGEQKPEQPMTVGN